MESVNAGAAYSVAGRLLEADKRGMWKADARTLEKLRKIYLRAEGLLEEGKG